MNLGVLDRHAAHHAAHHHLHLELGDQAFLKVLEVQVHLLVQQILLDLLGLESLEILQVQVIQEYHQMVLRVLGDLEGLDDR